MHCDNCGKGIRPNITGLCIQCEQEEMDLAKLDENLIK